MPDTDTEIAVIKTDIKHIVSLTDGLSGKFEKLIDALAQNNKESAERNIQIRMLTKSQEDIKTEIKEVKGRMWFISIAIAFLSSAGTVGIENALKFLK